MADSPKKHFCPYENCKSAFNRPYRLALHLLTHNNFRAFVCREENCNKSYTSKSHLDRHINTAHKDPDNDVIYSCPMCLKIYANRQNLKRHITIHHYLKVPFTCDTCKQEFKKKHQLSAHIYIHTGIKAFSCEECSKQFVTLHEKKRHLRCHKTNMCLMCKKTFTKWSEYQKHVTTQHQPEEYICNECGRDFKLRIHIVRHLKSHELVTKVYPCPYENCGRSYSRNSNLRQHIFMKHEKLTFDCNICERKLSTKAKLNQHLTRLHGVEEPKKITPKVKATGRKPRKDIGTLKLSTALKLAGLPRDPTRLLHEPEVLIVESTDTVVSTINNFGSCTSVLADPFEEIKK